MVSSVTLFVSDPQRQAAYCDEDVCLCCSLALLLCQVGVVVPPRAFVAHFSVIARLLTPQICRCSPQRCDPAGPGRSAKEVCPHGGTAIQQSCSRLGSCSSGEDVGTVERCSVTPTSLICPLSGSSLPQVLCVTHSQTQQGGSTAAW